MLNFVMCDDNLNALNKLSHMFESVFMKYDLKAQIAFKTTNEHELLSYVKENPTDVIILDININSNKDGLNLAEFIRKNNKNTCQEEKIMYSEKVMDHFQHPRNFYNRPR